MIDRVIAFDTSVVSENGGDQIIMKYINPILLELFRDDFIVHVPTHDKMGRFAKMYCKEAGYKIICGTNILSSEIFIRKNWEADPFDLPYLKGSLLLGCGWKDYRKAVSPFARMFWNGVLAQDGIHSVRDEYTKKRLHSLGITNVINTACPTMWGLTEEFCKEIETKKANNVITTVTNYRMDRADVDKHMFETLKRNYENVFVWIQALEDYSYLKELGVLDDVNIIPPGLHNYEKALENPNIEYCGTRLHAGIECLNHKKRALIIAKDNRAIEIGNDTGLPVLNQDEIDKLESRINSDDMIKISIPQENIERWKSQFTGGESRA